MSKIIMPKEYTEDDVMATVFTVLWKLRDNGLINKIESDEIRTIEDEHLKGATEVSFYVDDYHISYVISPEHGIGSRSVIGAKK